MEGKQYCSIGSRFEYIIFDYVLIIDAIAAKMETLFWSWILSHLLHLSPNQLLPSRSGMELNSSTGTSLQKCFMTRRA